MNTIGKALSRHMGTAALLVFHKVPSQTTSPITQTRAGSDIQAHSTRRNDVVTKALPSAMSAAMVALPDMEASRTALVIARPTAVYAQAKLSSGLLHVVLSNAERKMASISSLLKASAWAVLLTEPTSLPFKA